MSLEEDLGLIELTPVQMAYKDPNASRLKQVPKTSQTPQLVEFVIAHDGMALHYASKKLITDSLCKMAVRENGLALACVPENYVTTEICDLAVGENGLALAYVPEKFITVALAHKAVNFYYVFDRFSFFENRNDAIKNGQKQGKKLKENHKYPIAYVPPVLLTEQMIIDAVKYSPHSLRDIPQKMINKEIALTAVSIDGTALCYIPKNIISSVIIETAISNNPVALEFVPSGKKTEEMCRKCFEENPLVIQYMPNEYLSATMCDTAFKRNPDSFKFMPEEYKTLEMCLAVVHQENFGFHNLYRYTNTLLFEYFPEDKRNNKVIIDAILKKYENGAKLLLCWNERIIEKNESKEEYPSVASPLCKEIVEYLNEKANLFDIEQQAKSLSSELESKVLELQTVDRVYLEVPLEPLSSNSLPVEYENNSRVIHNLADEEASAKTIYYVTDIHLEHQLKPVIEKIKRAGISYSTNNFQFYFELIKCFLSEKVQELISSVEDRKSILLIGGDVANSKELTILFYKILSALWEGTILFILGNHELWDGHPEGVINARTVDDIVNEYRDMPQNEQLNQIKFLENDIYIIYKNQLFGERVIREDQILSASNEELADICSKTSMIILGGIGFSGLNPYYNAERGLYRATVASLEHDKELSERFCRVYRKLNQCAGNKRVIVFTHTPVYNWTNELCNSNWIYINGHTHHNNLVREENGATILADNQIGYKPQKWRLNALTISGWYDPFEKWQDGIYEITSEQYKDFNVGRGIKSKGCNYPGKIYALKRDNLYMFLLETSSSLCLLIGGQRKGLEHNDVQYYFDNMGLYGRIVREAVKPYQQVLEAISKEVKSFGGTGRIHGCIVDISWFSHIYVNPFDGKITVYWALDISSRLAFNNIQRLLEEKEPLLLERFMLEQKRKMLPMIDKHMMKKSCKAKEAVIPKWVFGTEIYAASRDMMSVQYIWSQNVIRMWNEHILKAQTDRRVIKNKEMKRLSE